MESSGEVSCRKLERVASRVGAGVASAFFASLETCACINLSTIDHEDDGEARPARLARFAKARPPRRGASGRRGRAGEEDGNQGGPSTTSGV